MSFVLALAVRDLGMTVDQALTAATYGAAAALRRDDIGRIAAGKRADLVILEAPSYEHLVYRPGVPLVAATVARGTVEWLDPDFAAD
jgi:imidazolonepropionase